MAKEINGGKAADKTTEFNDPSIAWLLKGAL
jgi:hypothetical protein